VAGQGSTGSAGNRFGEIAVREGFATRAQVRECLEIQAKLRSYGVEPKKIGEILVEQGFVSPEDLERALALQREQRTKRLGDVMIEMGLASHKMIGIALSIQYNVPFTTLDAARIDPALRARLPADLARRWKVLPLAIEGDLFTVAVSDPTHWRLKDALRAQTGCVVAEVVATPQDIARAQDVFYGSAQR